MLEFLQRVAVVLTLVGGAAFALSLEDHGLLVRLRRRFVLGVPWGTVVTVLGVLAVYLFVQGGYTHWYRPVVIPFRAWSYLAPLGMLTAGFAHAGPGHLLGNLFGTVALAPIVEYAFGHFPRERGASSFGSLQTNPYVRALLVFPATVAIVGVTLTLFTLGPVIGFSGVVFAFAGFALVRYRARAGRVGRHRPDLPCPPEPDLDGVWTVGVHHALVVEHRDSGPRNRPPGGCVAGGSLPPAQRGTESLAS